MGAHSEAYVERNNERKLIYVYKKNYAEEKGFLKIGDASIDKPNEDLRDNSSYLMACAEKRIRNYDKTSPISILHTTIAATEGGNWKYFRDYQVHEVLERSGFPKIKKGTSTEWFEINLEQALMAINAYKNGRDSIGKITSLDGNERVREPIDFRPEQEIAINKTIKAFKKYDDMLWNAKMRFGKTLCALEVCNQKQFQKTLILTHRPIVNENWFEDFGKIFYVEKNNKYEYGSKRKGERIESLLRADNENPFVYFASMQDLRGSSLVNSEKGFDKNEEVFKVDWDFIVIDEAHEGTKTKLAENVISELRKEKTKVLKLSGTPFNLLDEYEDDQLFTWDYVMEQEAKANWDANHGGDSNPYSGLPELKMFVYELGKIIKNDAFIDIETKAFNFTEFFKVFDTNDEKKFVYEKYVWEFLNLISRSEDYASDKTNMPYSTREYREALRHTLWTMPRRESAVALEILLKKHPVFGSYNIANLVDDGDTNPDLEKIKVAITDEPENAYSITLTVRKATVGVTVKEWTGILVLNNTESASNYLQSVFRIQSPYIGKDGQKERAYIFDFAPDRTLKMVAEAAKLNTKGGSLNNTAQQEQMKKLLNFLPIVGIDGSEMKAFNFKSMLTQLKRAQAERAVSNGFDDVAIYNDELLRLTEMDLKEFENLKAIVGKTMQSKKLNEIDINNQGLTGEEWEKAEKGTKKPKKERTAEEIDAMEKRKQLSKQKQTMISILRGISIRIPLMIYGMNMSLEEDVTIDNFTSKVDDISWKEFMPAGVSKDEFDKFKKYYDAEIFIEAGHRIRRAALAADQLSFEERIEKITNIFANFKNPDKETVLTPWRVVNMHLGESLGGYNFFNADYSEKLDGNEPPHFIDKGEVTKSVFSRNRKILEINSKTGLYPLYIAFSIYKMRFNDEHLFWQNAEWNKKDNDLWRDVLENNIFVLNKTPMARTITYRTLNGYAENDKVWKNLVYIEDLTQKLKTDLNKTTEEIMEKFGGDMIKFDAVVGNPPYQEEVLDINSSEKVNKMSRSIYPDFAKLAKAMGNISSLIMPARWMSGENGPYRETSDFVKFMIENHDLVRLDLFPNSSDVFSNVDIKGGVVFYITNKDYSGKTIFTVHEDGKARRLEISFEGKENDNIIIRFPELMSIVDKVFVQGALVGSMKTLVSSRNPYGFVSDLFTKNNEKARLSDTRLADDDYLIHGLYKGKREQRYIANEDLKKNITGALKYKVLLPRANGSGVFGEVFSTPMLGAPMQIATDTFLEVGQFDTEDEAKNLLKYVKTRFFRAMVGVKKTAVFNYKDAFTFVPLQDFTPLKGTVAQTKAAGRGEELVKLTGTSDIDWSKSISEIDQQLFAKYDLSQDEVEFIETKVKMME